MPDQMQDAENTTQDRTKVRKLLLRPAIDAAVVFSALCVFSIVCGPAPSSARPSIAGPTGYAMTMSPAVVEAIGISEPRPIVEIATTASPTSPEAVYRRTSAQTAWMLLLMSLSVIVALNMALFRHLRQAYTPRRIPQNAGVKR